MDVPSMSIKLLVDNKASRVLFAEVPKEFVDLLFGIFSLPFGTVFEFLRSNQMVGSLGNLKDSMQSFHENYLQPGIRMDDIFKPKTAFNSNTFFFPNSAVDQAGTTPKVPKETTYCSDQNTSGNRFPAFGVNHFGNREPMSSQSIFGNSKSCTNNEDKNKKGYVKEVVTYMVMDDLVVKPMSTIFSITLLNKCGINDMSQLEEKTVSFGKEEGMKLLNASLKTDKVLTSIFMPI
ncbi:uncharacterized protein LOC143549987 [Bidens hawaiensis]|uniref:uncharacterized protein LOC143549987 n=1 Tax=Bidens hawaiensis TaxID=980011 RepID=UPI00404B4D29